MEEWLQNNYIKMLDRPVYFPDLNLIENLCGVSVRSVYVHQTQFDDVESIKNCILDASHSITTNSLQKLVNSLQKRCIEIVVGKVKKIDY